MITILNNILTKDLQIGLKSKNFKTTDLSFFNYKNKFFNFFNIGIDEITGKIKIKAFKFNLLRYITILVPENFFFLLVFKNFKKKKANKLLFRRLGGPMPKIVWLSLRTLEPLLILNSLLYTLNKVHFLIHRKLIKKVTTVLLLILVKYRLILGFEFFVVGKVSVGGNARTRTFNTIFGMRSRSKLWVLGKKVNDIVYSITGCLGISIFFSF